MKKNFLYAVLLCLILLFSTSIVYASYSNFAGLITSLFAKDFGGKITDSQKASKIKELENSNYSCAVAGKSIEINPQKKTFPTSYYIPPSVTSKTKNQLMNNQQIIGKYSGKTTITCIFNGEPPTTQIVTLDTMKIYGNSKK